MSAGSACLWPLAIAAPCVLLTTSLAPAAVMTDGSIFNDDFSVNANSPDPAKWVENDTFNNAAPPGNMFVSGGFLHVTRTVGGDAFADTLPLAYGGATEWFAETRVTVPASDTGPVHNMVLLGAYDPGSQPAEYVLSFRDVFIGNDHDPARWQIGVQQPNHTFLVIAPNLNRGTLYTVGAHHRAAGGPGFADDLIDFWINGALVHTQAVLGDGQATFLRLGDTSGGIALAADWDYVSLGAANIPEPTTGLLAASGALTLLSRGRRR